MGIVQLARFSRWEDVSPSGSGSAAAFGTAEDVVERRSRRAGKRVRQKGDRMFNYFDF